MKPYLKSELSEIYLPTLILILSFPLKIRSRPLHTSFWCAQDTHVPALNYFSSIFSLLFEGNAPRVPLLLGYETSIFKNP